MGRITNDSGDEKRGSEADSDNGSDGSSGKYEDVIIIILPMVGSPSCGSDDVCSGCITDDDVVRNDDDDADTLLCFVIMIESLSLSTKPTMSSLDKSPLLPFL